MGFSKELNLERDRCVGEQFLRTVALRPRSMLTEELLELHGDEEVRISEVQSKISRRLGPYRWAGDPRQEKRNQELVLRKVPGGTLTMTSNFGLETVLPSRVNTVLQNSFS